MMILNNLKVSLRNLVAQRGHTLINLFGLAVGIASALMIILYVIDEFSYDKFHPDAGNIYRVCLDAKLQDTEMLGPISNTAIGPASCEQYPDIMNFTRLFTFTGEPNVSYGDRTFVEKKLFYADSTFFQVFGGFRLVSGNPANILNAPNQLVMTQSTARRYFGDEDPTGKTVRMWGTQEWEVVGIAEDTPSNSHIKFDIIGSFITMPMSQSTTWVANNVYTYIVLQEGTSPKDIDTRFEHLVLTYAGPVFEELMGASMEELETLGNRYSYFLQPLTDIHLRSEMPFEMEVGGNITMVYVFILIALFILFIAAINFMNLATARSAKRAKEVGLRKIVGSTRLRLVSQFLTESVLLTLFALVAAVVIVVLAMPAFNSIAGKQIILSALPVSVTFGVLLATLLIVGFAAGSYPAFFLANISPMVIFRGKFAGGMKSGHLRGILVTFQFIITIGLLIATFVVFSQISFIRSKDLGYNPQKLLVINRPYVIPSSRQQSFEDELRNLPGVEAIARSTSLPTTLIGNTIMRKEGASPDDIQTYNVFQASYDFDKALGLRIEEGRYFNRDYASDSSAIVINQAAARGFGFTGSPLGQKIFVNLDDERTVVGVIGDFHYESLHQNISPLVIVFAQSFGYLTVRFGDLPPREMIRTIEAKWNEFVPDQVFDYFFLEEAVAGQYSNERRAGMLFSGFSILGIIIASLGLLGLSSYSAEQRTREMGIRKVLGATEGIVIWLLLKEVNRLFIIATLVSWPLAWYLMSSWLNNFAFRISLSPLIFISASVISYLIAVLMVSYQALKAARANPAVTLKYE
jgi:putative ABC transport system permease protein